MRSWVRIVFTIACVSGGILAIAKVFAADSAGQAFPGKISRLVDGDTMRFRSGSPAGTAQDVNVRMVGIDAPEWHLPVAGSPPVGQGKYGEAAGRYLESLTPLGTKVTLQSFGKDKYSRVLGRFYYRKRDVNLQMVRAGWAVPYFICEGKRCNENFFEREHVAEYLAACDEARQARRGIFHPSHTLKEMPYEFRLRMQKRQPNKFVGDIDTYRLYEPNQIRAVDLCRRIFFLKREEAERLGFKL